LRATPQPDRISTLTSTSPGQPNNPCWHGQKPARHGGRNGAAGAGGGGGRRRRRRGGASASAAASASSARRGRQRASATSAWRRRRAGAEGSVGGRSFGERFKLQNLQLEIHRAADLTSSARGGNRRRPGGARLGSAPATVSARGRARRRGGGAGGARPESASARRAGRRRAAGVGVVGVAAAARGRGRRLRRRRRSGRAARRGRRRAAGVSAGGARPGSASVDFPFGGSQYFRWRGPQGNVSNSGGGAFRAGSPLRRSQFVQGRGRGEQVEFRRGPAGHRRRILSSEDFRKTIKKDLEMGIAKMLLDLSINSQDGQLRCPRATRCEGVAEQRAKVSVRLRAPPLCSFLGIGSIT
jgi:hypothetical protein